MSNQLNTLLLTVTLLLICVCAGRSQEMIIQLHEQRTSPEYDAILQEHFADYTLAVLNTRETSSQLRSAGYFREIRLIAGDIHVRFDLQARDIRAAHYKFRAQTAEGIIEMPRSPNKTYAGRTLDENHDVRITADDGFFTAMIVRDGDILYIQPAKAFIADADPDQVVTFYASQTLKKMTPAMCGVPDRHHAPGYEHIVPQAPLSRAPSTQVCRILEIALASDWLMFDKYESSMAAVETHNLAVINNVETNYDDDFMDDIVFEIVEIYVVTSMEADPWTNSTNAGELLDDFADWAPGGFSNVYDVASLWTDRDFDGPTIGLAYLGTICSPSPYNVLQDFSMDADLLRVLQAHEIGHNFNATHDPAESNTIMRPTVINTNTWSAQSINEINGWLSTATCMAFCCENTSPLSGIYTVGTGGEFATLFDGLYNVYVHGLSDHTTFHILHDLELTQTLQIEQWNYCVESNFTLTISPGPSTNPVISGNLPNGLIALNGTNSLIIDGSNNGMSSKDLTLRNTHADGPTLRLINGATDNTFKNLVIEGATSVFDNLGVIMFGQSNGAIGNSHNLIENCTVRDHMAGAPRTAIVSQGSPAAPNAHNTILGCEIFNWGRHGVRIMPEGAGDNWLIGANHFYQTQVQDNMLIAIRFEGGSGHSISDNYIGGTEPFAGGDPMVIPNDAFGGIRLKVGADIPSGVQGNTVKNIRTNNTESISSYGIFVEEGMAYLGTEQGNMIGSGDPEERLEFNTNSFGIFVGNMAGAQVSNNTIDHLSTPPSPPGVSITGISMQGSGDGNIVSDNIIRNIINHSEPSGGHTQTTAISVVSTDDILVSGNLIEHVGNTNPAPPASFFNFIRGILIIAAGPGTVVEKNNIRHLYASSADDRIYGIHVQDGENSVYRNNMISLDGGDPGNRIIYGIYQTAMAPSANAYYYNSVHIHGSSPGGNFTSAFLRQNEGTLTLRNNILNNVRTGGFHLAVVNFEAPGWPPETSDYNILHTGVPASVASWLGPVLTFEQWQNPQNGAPPGSGGDHNSHFGDPQFISDADLHINPASTFAANKGVPVVGVTDDFDGDLRSPTEPAIGADEYTCSAAIVESDDDDGPGTLREIIRCMGPGDVVAFSPDLTGSTIGLMSEIPINKNLTIEGLGITELTLSGQNSTRIFHLMSGNTLLLKNITLSDGHSAENGGAIFTEGLLTLENMLLLNNFEGFARKALSVTPLATVEVRGVVEMWE